MPSRETFYGQLRKCLSCLAKMTGDMFGGVKVSVSNVRTLYQLSSTVLLMHHGCFPASGTGALHKEDIMKKKKKNNPPNLFVCLF